MTDAFFHAINADWLERLLGLAIGITVLDISANMFLRALDGLARKNHERG